MILIFFLILLISILEEVIFIVPSTLVAILSGLVFINFPLSISNCFLFFVIIVLPLAFGMTIGSVPIFYLARQGLSWFGHRIKTFEPFLLQAHNLLKQYPNKTRSFFGFLRCLPFFSGLVTTLFGGLLNLDLMNYLWITFVGNLIRNGILAFLAWQFSNLFFKFFYF